jgi:hypothetical protein
VKFKPLVLRQDLDMYLGLASNSPPSCFCLLSAGLTNMYHHAKHSYLILWKEPGKETTEKTPGIRINL